MARICKLKAHSPHQPRLYILTGPNLTESIHDCMDTIMLNIIQTEIGCNNKEQLRQETTITKRNEIQFIQLQLKFTTGSSQIFSRTRQFGI